jgi:hypothetical protein
MKVIYIAGPFRGKNAWEIENNVRYAENVGFKIMNLGHMPLIPHSNTRYFHGTLPCDFFIQGTLELMRRCDAVLLIGKWEQSQGSLGEKSEAERLKIPVFFENEIYSLLNDFLKKEKESE